MNEQIEDAVKEYQCSGCVNGSYPECFKVDVLNANNLACQKHCVGTSSPIIGKIFLGLPTGFNRLGPADKMPICIFEKLEDGWGYDKFNVPVWKYRNENNHIIVRGLSPRVNYPFIHIFIEDCLDKINCLEITNDDLEEMD